MKSSVDAVDRIMEKDVLSVRPKTNLLEAANILFEQGLTGLPVVDDIKKVVGILTEYDLITKGSAIHLPTFLKLMRDVDVYRKDEGSIKGDLKKIMGLTVGDVMNDDPLTVTTGASIDEVAKIFAEHHRVNPIPVVDDMHRLVGIVSRFDIIKLYAGTHRIRRTSDTGGEATDRDIDNFVRKINRNFVFVRKSRTRIWFLASAVFLLIGIFITLFFTVRVEPNF
ncbi:MAG: CBS domain-containing protein [Candidatus Ryanbacteria bacterium]|nr:CBS domain-containing protein [Candidatus Ryanbacteria bacterium]